MDHLPSITFPFPLSMYHLPLYLSPSLPFYLLIRYLWGHHRVRGHWSWRGSGGLGWGEGNQVLARAQFLGNVSDSSVGDSDDHDGVGDNDDDKNDCDVWFLFVCFSYWGMNGFFKIRRGINNLGIQCIILIIDTTWLLYSSSISIYSSSIFLSIYHSILFFHRLFIASHWIWLPLHGAGRVSGRYVQYRAMTTYPFSWHHSCLHTYIYIHSFIHIYIHTWMHTALLYPSHHMSQDYRSFVTIRSFTATNRRLNTFVS